MGNNYNRIFTNNFNCFNQAFAVFLSSDEVGSSKIISLGFLASAIAILILCF